MKDIESILYSLIPLVLIILFSWLFSFLGSKMKKPSENGDQVPGRVLGDRFFDLMKEEESEEVPQQRQPQTPQPGITIPQGSGAPLVSAKPITPKWWGA
ncbi:hypothetical protein [Desulfomonile tiedjei]|uniref:Uncharacterized protein n=1 Tax=Desulfomonile tiedjei (strain ATCC 49306 / DSM 6799 / DCB-1) TaxID=706587 RepID=I4C8W4_DESTA|nr:hypothetical protein [Desulfomonile tiedjei]AFM26005.1 hypothetical protein Desti_3349 [Desulfomonile tiedjei DSM 6799]